MNTPEVQIGFVAVDDFANLEGTNTFRIGSNYDAILRAGEVVALADEDLGRVVRATAVVTDIFTGTLDDMLSKHGENNHHIAKEHSEVGVAELRAFLVDNYAEVGQVVDRTTPFSVIYFENVNVVEGVMGEEVVTEGPDSTEPALPPVIEEDNADEESED